LVLRPVAGAIARQTAAGVIMETVDLSFAGADVRDRVPAVPRTRFADVADRLRETVDAEGLPR